METKSFGTICGKEATLYYLENENFRVGISDYGGIINEFIVKTKEKNIDIVWGFDSAIDSVNSQTYAGAFIGRVANRVKNASFYLNGKKYELFKNDGEHCNHGGEYGFNRRFYNATHTKNSLTLKRVSVDGEEGFPANLNVELTYILKNDGLRAEIKAQADGDTYFAPTLHPYFNLSKNCESVKSTLLKINAQNYTEINSGEIKPLKNTVLDFLEFKPIGTFNYDHNFCTFLDYKATAINSESGVKLDVYSNLKGLQFYVAEFENEQGVLGKNGANYKSGQAFCLEPQYYPNAVNENNFEKPLLKKGETAFYYIEYVVTEVGNER